MFLYWDGYEIDGSDTDFEIVLPESVQTLEFAECFLSIPIFCDVPTPEYLYCNTQCHGIWHGDGCKKITLEELKSKLLSNDYSKLAIIINCQHSDLLTNELRSEVYGKSEKRKFNEDPDLFPDPEEPMDYSKIENPCVAPVIQNSFDRGGVTMSLLIFKDCENGAGEGGGTALALNVGPSAFYEYTMYVVDYLQERFPSIKTDLDGGLNTCGCTFSSSLYGYEKIQFPVKHSVKHTLKRLCEYGLMSYHSWYKNGHKHKCIANGFYPASGYWDYDKQLGHMPFSEYLELIEITSGSAELSTAGQVFETAVKIILPAPSMYKENNEIMQMLERLAELPEHYAKASGERRDEIARWYRSGYMSFLTVEGVTICELRVQANMKAYLQTWLNLMESGSIDFIKTEMHKRRNEDEHADAQVRIPKKKRK